MLDGWRRPNGLQIERVRVPLGVVAIIYENRPNVTSDAAGICLKSGNAALLRGSATALRSNLAIVEVLRDAATKAGNHLAMGPWSHGGWAKGDGDRLATLRWDAKSALWFRDSIEWLFEA